MVRSHLWQKPIWISYEWSSSWCLDMKAFTSPLSHDRCPREMGSLSCKVQRDTTAPGNHQMHQTPSCLINTRTACSTERNNNRFTIFLQWKDICGRRWRKSVFERWDRYVCGEFLTCRHSKVVKTETIQRLAIEEWNTELKHTIKISVLMAQDSWWQHGLNYWTCRYLPEPETWNYSPSSRRLTQE